MFSVKYNHLIYSCRAKLEGSFTYPHLYQHARLGLWDTTAAWATVSKSLVFSSFLVCSRHDIEKLERGTLRGKLYSFIGSNCLQIRGGREHLWSVFYVRDPVFSAQPAPHAAFHGGTLRTPACMDLWAEWRPCSATRDITPCHISASVCQISGQWKEICFTLFLFPATAGAASLNPSHPT